MSPANELAKQRTAKLVELRKVYASTAKKAQELLKHQQAERKALRLVLEAGSSSVPQLSSATGIPSHQVLWHIAALKKYGFVAEDGMDEAGEFYLYRLTKDAAP